MLKEMEVNKLFTNFSLTTRITRALIAMVVIILMLVVHIGCTHTSSNPDDYAKILSSYGWSPTYTSANFRYGCYTNELKTSQIGTYIISNDMLSNVFIAQKKHTDGGNMIFIATFVEQIDAKNCYNTATESIHKDYPYWYSNQDDVNALYIMASVSYIDSDGALAHGFKAVMLNQNSILLIEMNNQPILYDSLQDFSNINAEVINKFMNSTNAMSLIQNLYSHSDEVPIPKPTLSTWEEFGHDIIG